MKGKKVVIVGAGPGGLTAGMILSHRGFDVTVVEKMDRVGGRNAELKVGDYSFDTGPTFLHQKFTLDEVFAEAGRKSSDYIDFVLLDPMTKLTWKEKTMETSYDEDTMVENIREAFPGNEEGYVRFMEDHNDKLTKAYPVLQKPYDSLSDYLRPEIIRAVPYVATAKSVVDVLDNYFEDDRLKLAFTFQAKYLGMSPWKCPALFSILSYTEYKFGIYHAMGGLCSISHAMAKVIKEEGGEIRLNTAVKELKYEGNRATGVELESGEFLACDSIILNADYAHAITTLMGEKNKPVEKLKKKKFSCSTFMIYLGLDKVYEEEPHHHIIFADDYHKNVADITSQKTISEDMSVYVRNSSVTDKTVAPEGHSQLYILVPTINNRFGGDNWEEEKAAYKEAIIDKVIKYTGMKDLREHIVCDEVLTPQNWEEQGVFMGATFNLAHTMDQMLYFRPHNDLPEVENAYLVGGGTHPGSGLPTIYESGRISSNALCKKHGVNHDRVDLAPDFLSGKESILTEFKPKEDLKAAKESYACSI